MTYAEYKRLLDRHVRPAIGTLKAEDLKYDDVEKLHVDMQDTPRQANVVIAILSKACSWAGKNKHRKGLPNPVHGIERYKEVSRTVSLKDADIAEIGKALKAFEGDGETPQVFIDAARMVMLSQLRLSEVLSLRPEHIDTENSQLKVGTVKQKERVYPVGAVVLAYLAQFPRDKNSEWLFPSSKNFAKHLSKSALQHFWVDVRNKAKLHGVRLHDLRHLSGTFAGTTGANAMLIKDFLAHSTVLMSQRYVHSENDPKRQLADSVESRIEAALEGREGEVINMNRRG